MDEQEYKERFEFFCDAARQNFERDGELMGFIIWVSKDGDAMKTAPMIYEDDDEREIFVTSVKKMLIEDEAKWVATVSEAWTLVLKGKPPKMVESLPRPSEHPDRIEVVMVQLEYAGGAHYAQGLIKRDGDEVTLEDFETGHTESLDNVGRLSRMLPQNRFEAN